MTSRHGAYALGGGLSVAAKVQLRDASPRQSFWAARAQRYAALNATSEGTESLSEMNIAFAFLQYAQQYKEMNSQAKWNTFLSNLRRNRLLKAPRRLFLTFY